MNSLIPREKVVVAMSGGVDSSVSAALLAQKGYERIGVSMQVWDNRQNGGAKSRVSCCAPSDFNDARRVAGQFGIPYYVFDFEENFRKEVIERFVRSYEQGLTPNPCVDCNNKVKFRELRDRATMLGFDYLATGHYAQIHRDGSGYHLLRGTDNEKDQSYFLYGLGQDELAKTIFPVGHLTKDEVRKVAAEHGLVNANKAESQDICFVSGSVPEFLVKLGSARRRGEIVNQAGQKLGEHDGVQGFTVGQRRGINIGGGADPLYVTALDTARNQIVVGPRAELERESFTVNELSWCSPALVERVVSERKVCFEAFAQLRHRHKGVKVKVEVEAGQAKVGFLDEWAVVSPGQAAVFYDLENREVLGGGRIIPEAATSLEKSKCASINAEINRPITECC